MNSTNPLIKERIRQWLRYRHAHPAPLPSLYALKFALWRDTALLQSLDDESGVNNSYSPLDEFGAFPACRCR